MKKRLFSIFVLLCLVCSLMCACDPKKEITANQAVSIVFQDLGNDVKNASDPHVHTGTYNNQDCYNVYISVNGEDWVYIISAEGEILSKGPGGHSH